MRIMVFDIAAETGGAAAILKEKIADMKNDQDNEYYIVLSKLTFSDTENITFINYPWVKKSYLHRMIFELLFPRFLIKKYKPDLILSFQNMAIISSGIPQYVYYHNALPLSEHKFSFKESKQVWLYQNVIGKVYRRSLKYADRVYVQSVWMKNALVNKWKLSDETIVVETPTTLYHSLSDNNSFDVNTGFLFYPSNSLIYKNHLNLLKACIAIWENDQVKKKPVLVLTINEKELSTQCIDLIKDKDYPILFTGYIDKEEMQEYYKRSILVYPSFIESYGLPLIEAKQFKSIILVANCEYAHETLGDYHNAYYFDPNDYSELALLLLKLLNSTQSD